MKHKCWPLSVCLHCQTAWIIQLAAGTASSSFEQVLLQGSDTFPSCLALMTGQTQVMAATAAATGMAASAAGTGMTRPGLSWLFWGWGGVEGWGCLDGLTVDT